MKNKYRKVVLKTMCAAAMLLSFSFNNMKVSAQTGVTGYQIVVPAKGEDGVYVLIEDADKGRVCLLGRGFYELDGRPVYLDYNEIYTVLFADGYYVSQDGTVVPYNAETKGAIDAEVNALLQSKLAEAKNLYGINFNFKKGYNNAQNYHYVNGILQLLSEYPAGSIQVISNATAAKTKRPLTFRQLRNAGDDEVYPGIMLGTYAESSNTIQEGGDEISASRTLGRAMEKILNEVSGGQLRQTFEAMNGGYPYSGSYYYSGNEQIYDSFDEGIGRCVRERYSAISFSEDFADTFSDAMCYTSAELAADADQQIITKEYYQKVLYVKQLFNQYAGSTILQ